MTRHCPVCGTELQHLIPGDWWACDTCKLILPEETWRSKPEVEKALEEKNKIRNMRGKE